MSATELVNAVLKNRLDMVNTQGISNTFSKFLIKSVLYALIVLTKSIVGKFGFKMPSWDSKEMSISWSSIMKKRLLELPFNIPMFEYDYKQLSKSQISFFSQVRLRTVFSELLRTKIYEENRNSYQNNIFYRFVILMEYHVFRNLVHHNSDLEKIYIAGINDRGSIFLSIICEEYDVKLSVLQHGAFTKFPNQYLIKAHEFQYFYEFSLHYLKYFIANPDNVEKIYLPRATSRTNLDVLDNEKNIAFATTPIKMEINLSIIDLLLEGLSSEIKLVINPHPRDDFDLYIQKYGHLNNVLVTYEKFSNVEYFFLRYSTLGVEMKEIGIETFFINLENYETDFFEYGGVEVFTKLEDLREWLHGSSRIKSFYSLPNKTNSISS